MKKLLYLLTALILSLAILFMVTADVNHGNGPGVISSYEGSEH